LPWAVKLLNDSLGSVGVSVKIIYLFFPPCIYVFSWSCMFAFWNTTNKISL